MKGEEVSVEESKSMGEEREGGRKEGMEEEREEVSVTRGIGKEVEVGREVKSEEVK